MSGLRFTFAEAYERELVGPLFGPWASLLLDRAKIAAGLSLLDVACGTGAVARLAALRVGPQGRVVGVDASAQMLAVAAGFGTDVAYREGKAEALPVADEEAFDIVTCQQGLQFFPDPAAALREMRRVLRPGGRLAVATWCGVEEQPFVRDLQRVAERRIGPVVDQRYGFGDGERLRRMLVDAGFADVAVDRSMLYHRLVELMPFVRLNARALVAMSAACRAMDEAEKDLLAAAIVGDSAGVVESYGAGFTLAAYIALAH